jgi:hypothetical protein
MRTKPTKLFALHIVSGGGCDWVGEVLAETETTIRMELVNCLDLILGCGWNPSGELKDVPKAECRIFRDRESCLSVLGQINERRRSWATKGLRQ